MPSSPNGPSVRELGSRRSGWPRIYVAARDGRDALVMVTSASEVLSAPPAGCRIDELACGALTWCSGCVRFEVPAGRARIARFGRERDVILGGTCRPGDHVVDAGEAWPSEPR